MLYGYSVVQPGDYRLIRVYSPGFVERDISIWRYYPNLFSYENKAQLIDRRFFESPPIQEDHPIYRQQWIRNYAESIRQEFKLDNWIRIAAVTDLPLGMNWMEMDEFWMLAVTEAYNSYVKEQDDKQKQYKHDMEKQIENLKPHTSAFAGVPMPNFSQK